MANPEHVKVVKQGTEAIARWRKQHPEERLDLSGADLGWVDFSEANLSGSNVAGANLSFAKLHGTNLSNADLSAADLLGVDIFKPKLNGANLSKTNLSAANIRDVDLSGVALTAAICGCTSFHNCNLHDAYGLEQMINKNSTSIGVDTVIKSFWAGGNKLTPELEKFLLEAGIPRELLAELPRIVAGLGYRSCFICYGDTNREFAEKLCRDLGAKGVPCWLYSLDNTGIEQSWRPIRWRRREVEKMVVICSGKALAKEIVQKQIEEQIDEDRDDIIPVSLDNLWKTSGFLEKRRNLQAFLFSNIDADFSNDSPYNESLEWLLKRLKR